VSGNAGDAVPEEAATMAYAEYQRLYPQRSAPWGELAEWERGRFRRVIGAAVPSVLADFSKRTAGMAEALNNAAAIIEERDRQLAEARATERERLFTAIRRKIPLSQPWRGEALDLIAEVWRETDG
jgi:hypothetical protein